MDSKILILWIVLAIVSLGCTSREARLNQEYERISSEIEGLQSELKATVNTQNSAEDYAKAHLEYNKKLEKLIEVRKLNSSKGLPLGPEFDTSVTPEDLAKNLKKNFDTLSDKISELKKEKAKIAAEQMDVKE